MTKIRFKLTRPAKKAGGDRYEATTIDVGSKFHQEQKPIVIYVPQLISRSMGGEVVASEIEVTFDPK